MKLTIREIVEIGSGNNHSGSDEERSRDLEFEQDDSSNE